MRHLLPCVYTWRKPFTSIVFTAS